MKDVRPLVEKDLRPYMKTDRVFAVRLWKSQPGLWLDGRIWLGGRMRRFSLDEQSSTLLVSFECFLRFLCITSEDRPSSLDNPLFSKIISISPSLTSRDHRYFRLPRPQIILSNPFTDRITIQSVNDGPLEKSGNKVIGEIIISERLEDINDLKEHLKRHVQ